MRILIAGDGATATYLSKTLSIENQDIVLIGSSQEHLAELEGECNFITYYGDPSQPETLNDCDISNCDVFIAVTPNEYKNLVSCEIAKRMGARSTIARIDSPHFFKGEASEAMKASGVDRVIYPEWEAAGKLIQFVNHNGVNEWQEFGDGKLYLVGAKMKAEGSLCGRPLKETSQKNRNYHITAIRRNDKLIIPRGDDVICEGDTVYMTLLPRSIEDVQELCGNSENQIKHIIITGGGRITENFLLLAENNFKITVFESDRERCEQLAMMFPRVIVVNTSCSDIQALKDEELNECDMFMALTGSSEANIVSCMVAREHGVLKTVARIEELEYIPEAESLSIDRIINKKQLNAAAAINAIFNQSSAATQALSIEQGEIIMITAGENSPITFSPVAGLALPKGLTLVGIIRDGSGMLVEGSTQILPGDNVLVFFATGNLQKVKRLF